jgi:hypothetical protein
VTTMSTSKRRFPPAADKASLVAHERGEAKFRRIATAHGDASQQVSAVRSPPRPDPTILNESIPLFSIERNGEGFWVAQDCDGPSRGTFLFKASAVRFAKKASPECGLMFPDRRIELDPKPAQNARLHNAIKGKIARAIARVQVWLGPFVHVLKNGDEQRHLIESELYGNQYRYRSKSDDDLPIIH